MLTSTVASAGVSDGAAVTAVTMLHAAELSTCLGLSVAPLSRSREPKAPRSREGAWDAAVGKCPEYYFLFKKNKYKNTPHIQLVLKLDCLFRLR